MRLIVDGNNIAARAFHACSTLSTTDGRPCGMLHGFLQSVGAVKEKFALRNEDIYVVWDGGRSAKRMELLPSYKANRQHAETTDNDSKENWKLQLWNLRDNCLPLLPVKQIKIRGVEADDVIGILSNRSSLISEENTIIFSGDHDFYQLVDELTSVYNSKIRMDKPLMELSYGPDFVNKFLQMRAIEGDKSDNIDGIPEMGPVRGGLALKYVQFYPSFSVRDEQEIPKKALKYVMKVSQHNELLRRNIRLMKLPRTWSEAHDMMLYVGEEQTTYNESLYATPKNHNYEGFIKFLRNWELNTQLEHLNKWV